MASKPSATGLLAGGRQIVPEDKRTAAPGLDQADGHTRSNRHWFGSLWLLGQEQRLEMPLVEVFRHVLGDCRLTGFEHLQILLAHLSRNLVADMDQLPQVRINCRQF